MIKIGASHNNVVIPIDVCDITITARPLTTLDLCVCQSAARAKLNDMIQSFDNLSTSGLVDGGMDVDLNDPMQCDGLYQDLLIKEIGLRQIVSWSGVFDTDDKPVAVHDDAVRVLLGVSPVGEIFYNQITSGHSARNAAANRIFEYARWHFKEGGGKDFCGSCKKNDQPCAKGKSGRGGKRCPYIEYQPKTDDESAAWAIFLRSAGRDGVDYNVVVQHCLDQGIEQRRIIDLVSAAEMGMNKATSEGIENSGG